MKHIEDSQPRNYLHTDRKDNRRERSDLVACVPMAGFDELQHGDLECCHRLRDLENRNHVGRQLRTDLETLELRSQKRYRCVADPDPDHIRSKMHSRDHSMVDRPHAGLHWEGLGTDQAVGRRKAPWGVEDAGAAD